MTAAAIYFEFHDHEVGDNREVTQFIFIPRAARPGGGYTLPHLFSRSITKANPQRAFQRAVGDDRTNVTFSSVSSPRTAAVEAAPSLNKIVPMLLMTLGAPNTALYEHPLVVWLSDAELDELAADASLPRTFRDRFGRARDAQGWAIDLPGRK